MSKMIWDELGKKFYHVGVEQVALYPMNTDGTYEKGVPWSGIKNITDTPSGGEPTDIYADDQKYLSIMSAENHGGSITAYMYPDEWGECNGSVEVAEGVYITQQKRKGFGLVYKSLVGNDTEDRNYGYKLHLIWGAKATPSESSHETVNESPEATELSWEYTTTPIRIDNPINGKKLEPFAHMEIFSKNAEKIADLEKIIYGDEHNEPRLPMPQEVLQILMPDMG